MASLFQLGFQREAWKPTLGQTSTGTGTAASTDWAGAFAKALTTGSETYKAYSAEEVAEEQRKAAEATAEAQKATAAAQAAAAMANQEKKILGMPASYVLMGALGLGLLGVVVVMAKNK
jgi:hypothetical protein